MTTKLHCSLSSLKHWWNEFRFRRVRISFSWNVYILQRLSILSKNIQLTAGPLLNLKLHYSAPNLSPLLLLDLLQPFRAFNCSNPRDKVFGLFGLSQPHPSLLFEFDYSLSTFQIYINTAEYIIKSSNRLEVICTSEKSGCKGESGAHNGQDTLPSWVPNWSCTNLAGNLLLFRTKDVLGHWVASGTSVAAATIDGGLLTCTGILLGSIAKVISYKTPGTPFLLQLLTYKQH